MITSKQNSLIKLVRSLSDKKFRDKEGLYLVEGYKMVKEAFLCNCCFYKIIATEKGLEQFKKNKKDFDNALVEIVSDDIFNYISQENSPQGILSIIKKPLNKMQAPQSSCILLDGVSDPANVGAIIRTAAACGYNYIYATDVCADAYSPKSVRSSMSGVFRVNIITGNIDNILSVINKPIVVADMQGENIFNAKVPNDICLVIGNEGNGVSKKVKDIAKYVVSIPMKNNVESLNAAVSAGILMYCLNKN